MNIEIANRLIKLRKENGYSQEELADKLGISRQAVSKWERAEASPDTDNLILLARLYNMSLDDLLKTDESSEDIKKEHKKGKDYVHIGVDGIHVIDGENGDEVHVGFSGIQVNEGGEEKFSTHRGMTKEQKRTKKIVMTITWFVLTVAYVLTGLFLHNWYMNWLILLFVPVIDGTIESVFKKKVRYFPYEVFITIIYVYFGFTKGLWHPLWVIYLSIPFYRLLVDLIDKREKDDVEVTIENDDDNE